jgi:hypothetical protein
VEQERYRVCGQRNVAAAYGRFFGPDSGSQLAASQLRPNLFSMRLVWLRHFLRF